MPVGGSERVAVGVDEAVPGLGGRRCGHGPPLDGGASVLTLRRCRNVSRRVRSRHDGGVAVTRNELDTAIRDLGLPGRVVCVHSSLRSFGTVEGGADTVIDALLDARCTLLVPTHSWGFATNHVPGLRPPQNGWDYSMNVAPPVYHGAFSTESNAIDRNMGAIPRRCSRARSDGAATIRWRPSARSGRSRRT